MVRQAVILCGGMGTRLGAMTRITPKPLLHVGQGPFLDILLFEVARHGYKNVLLLAGFASEEILRYAASTPVRQYFELEIQVEIETAPAGTGGALWRARNFLHPVFLLINGDSWFDINLLRLPTLLTEDNSTLGVLALRQLPDATRYGTVEMNGSYITRFNERPDRGGVGLVSGGIYALRRDIVQFASADSSLERDVFPKVAQVHRLRGAVCDGYFIDIGVPDDLSRARLEIPSKRIRRAVFLDGNYIFQAGDIRRRPGANAQLNVQNIRRGIRWLNDAGYFVFVLDVHVSAPGVAADESNVNPAAGLAEVAAHIDDTSDILVCDVRDKLTQAQTTIASLMTKWLVARVGSFLIGCDSDLIEAAGTVGLQGCFFADGDFLRYVQHLPAEEQD